MGWTAQDYMSRDECIAEVRKPWPYDATKVAVAIASVFRSGCDWQVREYHVNGQPSGERFIVAMFIDCKRVRGERPGAAWKAVDETMGPARYDCPLKYLDMVAEPTGTYAGPWRARVRAHHAKASATRKRAIVVGGTYALINCKAASVRITQLKPLAGIASDGRLYRIPRPRLGEAITP